MTISETSPPVKPKRGTYSKLARIHKVSVQHISEGWRGLRPVRQSIRVSIDREKERQGLIDQPVAA
jgi:hypothetical protein